MTPYMRWSQGDNGMTKKIKVMPNVSHLQHLNSLRYIYYMLLQSPELPNQDI